MGERDRDSRLSRGEHYSSSRDYSDSRDRDRRERERDRDRRDRDDSHRSSKRSRRDERDDYDDDQHKRKERRRREYEEDDRSDRKRRETSEERAARKAERRARKEQEAALTAESRLAAAEASFYSATDNPFNDANLTDKFVWGKKRDKERKSGLTADEAQRRDAERRAEAQAELERLNQRRAEREREMALREEEQMRAAQAAESAHMAEWIAKEDDFHLEQAKRRASIRVRERRAKPIDFLTLNLKWSQPPEARAQSTMGFNDSKDDEDDDDGTGLEVDLDEPYKIFDDLALEDAKELHEDIKMYLSLEKAEVNKEFWRCLLIVSAATLERLEEERQLGGARAAARYHDQGSSNREQEGGHMSSGVRDQIVQLLSGKTHAQLVQLQGQIEGKLAQGGPIDTDYWETLLRELVVWKAKAKLRDMHEIVLTNRLEQLRRKQRDEAHQFVEDLKNSMPDIEEEGEEEGGELTEAPPAKPVAEELVRESWDPALEPRKLSKPMPDMFRAYPLVDLADEMRELVEARKQVRSRRFVVKRDPRRMVADAEAAEASGSGTTGSRRDEEIYQAAVGQGLDEEEEFFNTEVALASHAYSWEDKYRPRKPRYFNKVHTGFEWNKYNQTHYDSDNPPPKVVQGYKFNIFYPDLIDKSKAPQFKILKTPGNDDTCTLVFKAGPPYEDIAFTIVNKPWEHSHKRGFRSTFDRGVLQLHFNLQRQFYRK